jgi:hypothetical protein
MTSDKRSPRGEHDRARHAPRLCPIARPDWDVLHLAPGIAPMQPRALCFTRSGAPECKDPEAGSLWSRASPTCTAAMLGQG